VELKDTLILLAKYRWFLLAVAFFAAVVGYGVSLKWPVYNKASGVLFVNREAEKKVVGNNYYTYEGFYRQQTAERFTDTVVGLLKSEVILAAAGKSLGLSVDAAGLKKLSAATEVRKAAPQLVKLEVRQKTSEQATKLWQALAREGIEKVKALGAGEDGRLLLSQVTAEPLVNAVSPDPVLDTFVAAGLGLMVGIFAISLREYLRS